MRFWNVTGHTMKSKKCILGQNVRDVVVDVGFNSTFNSIPSIALSTDQTSTQHMAQHMVGYHISEVLYSSLSFLSLSLSLSLCEYPVQTPKPKPGTPHKSKNNFFDCHWVGPWLFRRGHAQWSYLFV